MHEERRTDSPIRRERVDFAVLTSPKGSVDGLSGVRFNGRLALRGVLDHRGGSRRVGALDVSIRRARQGVASPRPARRRGSGFRSSRRGRSATTKPEPDSRRRFSLQRGAPSGAPSAGGPTERSFCSSSANRRRTDIRPPTIASGLPARHLDSTASCLLTSPCVQWSRFAEGQTLGASFAQTSRETGP